MTDKKSMDTLDSMVNRVVKAQAQFAHYDQEKVDRIFQHAAAAATAHRIELAKMAYQETGMGVLEDKVLKNHFASEYIYNQYKQSRTCGVIEDDPVGGLRKIAEPLGVVAGIIPTTNPTSTAIFKALICLKTRNGLIISPHPKASRCTAAAARIILEAAVEAGAPENIIDCISDPSPELTQSLMSHSGINLILATGGPGMVHAAYCSGHPAIGVGAGNTPVVIDSSADIKMSVNSILLSKTFDNGLICASEQSVIVLDSIADRVIEEFCQRGAWFANEEQSEKIASVLFHNGSLNSEVVGQSAFRIASMAGIEVPEDTKVIISERKSVRADDPYAHEKLSPVLGFYRAAEFSAAVDMAQKLLLLGGAGHTASLYISETEREKITVFENRLTAGRILINMPAAQGAIGDMYNFRIAPSLTLGCGSWGGNSVSENIGVKHLMNIKTVASRRENMLWYRIPPQIYFKFGAIEPALAEYSDRKRACIITDKTMESMGHVHKLTEILDKMGMETRIFSSILPDPDIETVQRALEMVNFFNPDIIVALGGGSPMDAAKVLWFLYENPDIHFDDMALRFMDIRKRVVAFPKTGRKAALVAVPTTSGTGSEVTPFAVITDTAKGIKYPLADYALTPDMAIVDPEFVMDLPKSLIANAGMDALSHAIEAYTSTLATNFSDGNALEAIRLIFKYLEASYRGGEDRAIPREKMHYAATIAGMAFANAFLGLCHSMAHALGSYFHLPHGLANAILLDYIIEFNATDAPTKQGILPQYKYPWVKGRYARIADMLHLADDISGDSPVDRENKTGRLVMAIENLKHALNIPASIKDAGVPERDFLDKVDLLSEQAFDDQCTLSNPRFPLISEIRDLYLKAYYGEALRSSGS